MTTLKKRFKKISILLIGTLPTVRFLNSKKERRTCIPKKLIRNFKRKKLNLKSS
jgi:hypothetical protein